MLLGYVRSAFVVATAMTAAVFFAEPSAASAATYIVDGVPDVPSRNQCTSANNDCSLRGAIDKATNTSGTHTIVVPNGTYTLSSVYGQLVVTKSMTIRGAGGNVIIQAATTPGVATHRVLGVSAGTLTLANVEIRHGAGESGAGIWVGSSLNAERVLVRNNHAPVAPVAILASGGGIYVNGGGQLTLRRSAVLENRAGIGGGIAVFGNASIINTTLSGNRHSWDNASAIGVFAGGTAALDSVTIFNNTGLIGGAGETAIYQEGSGSVTIKNSIVSENTTPLGSQNCWGNIVSLGNNVSDTTECPFTTGVNGDEEGVAVALAPLQTFSAQVVGHLPLPGSKAIDTATYSGAACQTVDQRNNSRPRDGDGNGTAICDKGAIERLPTD